MADWKDVADLLFPEVTETIDDLLNKYPERSEPVALRFAPSPTGFLHIGSLATALIGRIYSTQHMGSFILRIEDTDQKREIEGAAAWLISSFSDFWFSFDEGPLGENESDIGNYGPYFQSQRGGLYRVFIKDLMKRGLAYPCWMTEEELNTIREQQTKAKQVPGIYGEFSTYRAYTPDEIIAKYHKEDDSFPVVRFRSHGDMNKRIIFTDMIRWAISMVDNYNDIVILKGDGLPTYHLAHIVDDSLMRVSLVTRGDEWLMSGPLHLQLFEAVGLKAPQYAHLAPICKMDNGKKRKLSKRHDPEANVTFLLEKGYSVQGILDYILNVTNSLFEDWRREYPESSIMEFDLKMDKMSSAGPLFDEVKLNWVNNNYLSQISTDKLFEETLIWAKEFQPDFSQLLLTDEEYAKAAMNIERHTEKDPKRFTLYSDVQNQLLFFFDDEWESWAAMRKALLSEQNLENLAEFVKDYIMNLNLDTDDTLIWFEQLKEIGRKYGYAGNNAEFKEGGFVGKIGDLAMFLRIQLCNAKQTPDLFSVMKVMGKSRVVERLEEFLR